MPECERRHVERLPEAEREVRDGAEAADLGDPQTNHVNHVKKNEHVCASPFARHVVAGADAYFEIPPPP